MAGEQEGAGALSAGSALTEASGVLSSVSVHLAAAIRQALAKDTKSTLKERGALSKQEEGAKTLKSKPS